MNYFEETDRQHADIAMAMREILVDMYNFCIF